MGAWHKQFIKLMGTLFVQQLSCGSKAQEVQILNGHVFLVCFPKSSMIHTHTHTHTLTHTRTHTHIHTHHTHTHTLKHTYTRIHVYTTHTHTYTHKQTHTCTHACAHHTYTHTHTHTHTHTRAHKHAQQQHSHMLSSFVRVSCVVDAPCWSYRERRRPYHGYSVLHGN